MQYPSYPFNRSIYKYKHTMNVRVELLYIDCIVSKQETPQLLSHFNTITLNSLSAK